MFLLKNKQIQLFETVRLETLVHRFILFKNTSSQHRVKTQFELSNLIRSKTNTKPLLKKQPLFNKKQQHQKRSSINPDLETKFQIKQEDKLKLLNTNNIEQAKKETFKRQILQNENDYLSEKQSC